MDHVAVADQRDGARVRGFRPHLADHDGAVDQAGQLPVGDHGDLAGEP